MRKGNDEAGPKEGAGPGPGALYVLTYLQALSDEADPTWLAECVDSGALLACPRCHFLRLPALPFPPAMVFGREGDAPAGDCDVCGHVPSAARSLFHQNGLMAMVEGWEGELGRLRCRRAEALHTLWIGGLEGADAWLLESVGRTVGGVLASAHGGGMNGSEGGTEEAR